MLIQQNNVSMNVLKAVSSGETLSYKNIDEDLAQCTIIIYNFLQKFKNPKGRQHSFFKRVKYIRKKSKALKQLKHDVENAPHKNEVFQ